MRRFLFLALLPFAVSAFATASTTNAPAHANTNTTSPAVPPSSGKKPGDGAAIPLDGSISCLSNGHIAIDGVDQGGASVCAGPTEISCAGGLHIIRNSYACQV